MRTVFLVSGLVVLATAPAAAQPKKKTGTIAGVVRFDGTPPPRAKLRRDTDPVCAKVDKLAEDVIVGDGGKLRDVVVRIKNGTAGKHAAPASPLVLDQTECMYRPRINAAMAGQKLAIRNSDATYHNVRGTLGARTLWNSSQPAGDPEVVRDDLKTPGDVVELQCDVHPWMHAWIAVHDHPFFAVTGDDGAFTIKDVPVGTYTLEAWHPALGMRSTKIKVAKGKTAKAAFKLAPPPKPADDQ
jgi:plastocyanin